MSKRNTVVRPILVALSLATLWMLILLIADAIVIVSQR
jgi:hypothetical protein